MTYIFDKKQVPSASYADTASYISLLAGPNIEINYGPGSIAISGSGIPPVISGSAITSSYGSFYSTASQLLLNGINVSHSMSFTSTNLSNGVYISGSDMTKIKFESAGVYNIQFSAQIDRTAGAGNSNTLIWISQNGVAIPDTNTSTTIVGSTNEQYVAAWNWFVSASMGDYIQLMWASDDTHSRIHHDPSPIVGPRGPSVILTANRVDVGGNVIATINTSGSTSTGSTSIIIPGNNTYVTSASSNITIGDSSWSTIRDNLYWSSLGNTISDHKNTTSSFNAGISSSINVRDSYNFILGSKRFIIESGSANVYIGGGNVGYNTNIGVTSSNSIFLGLPSSSFLTASLFNLDSVTYVDSLRNFGGRYYKTRDGDKLASKMYLTSTDHVVLCYTSYGNIDLELPPDPLHGQVLFIKDVDGNAGTYPVNILPLNGQTIDGSGFYRISNNGEVIQILFNSVTNDWIFLSKYFNQ